MQINYAELKVDVENEKIQLPDGTEISAELACSIMLAYERMCTANYLRDTYEEINDVVQSWSLADKVRDLMDDTGMSEDDAVYEVLSKEGIE